MAKRLVGITRSGRLSPRARAAARQFREASRVGEALGGSNRGADASGGLAVVSGERFVGRRLWRLRIGCSDGLGLRHRYG